MTMSVKFAVRSETGHVRDNNEDNFFCNGIYMTPSERDKPFFMTGAAEIPCIFAVFDGMGGHDCGELASFTAAETLAEHAGKIRAGSHEDADAFVKDANTRLLRLMNERGIKTGTTITMAVLGHNFFTCYNLGDSRIYSVRNDAVIRITSDHNLAEEMVLEGRLDPKRAEESRYSNILTRFAGMTDDDFTSSPDIYTLLDYESNRRLLLCSDGLNKMLKHHDIAAVMKSAASPSDAVNGLADAALDRGGYDNVTCIVIDIPSSPTA